MRVRGCGEEQSHELVESSARGRSEDDKREGDKSKERVRRLEDER